MRTQQVSFTRRLLDTKFVFIDHYLERYSSLVGIRPRLNSCLSIVSVYLLSDISFSTLFASTDHKENKQINRHC